MRTQTEQFHVRFTAAKRRKLQDLADLNECSASLIIQNLIVAAWNTQFKKIPYCANGSPCVMPQIWLQNQPRHPDTQPPTPPTPMPENPRFGTAYPLPANHAPCPDSDT